MKARRVASLAMASVLAGTLLAGCGGSTGNSTSSGSAASGTTGTASSGGTSKYQTTYGSKQFNNVTLKVELFDRSNAPSGSTITDNRWTKYCQDAMKKVGINLEFVPVPRSDEVTKMQTMMASQTAADIMLTYTYSMAESYFDQGGTWDLTDFIDGEDQAKNLKAYLGDDVLNIGRKSDNRLYGVVAKRATTAEDNIYIRKDWLDDLGLAVPTTPDELLDDAQQFVQKNPGNVSNPIGLWPCMTQSLRMAFSQVLDDPVKSQVAFTEDVIWDYYDPGMKEMFRWMNKAYNSGTMHSEYYTMKGVGANSTGEDQYKSYIVNGQLGCFEDNVNYGIDVLRGSLLKTLQENIPTAELTSVPGLKNVNDGKVHTIGYSKGGLICFVPKTASEEVAEAAVTYMDWMCSKEGGFVIYHGFEGEHYQMEDGVPAVIDSQYNATDKDWIRTDLFITGNQGYFDSEEEFNKTTATEQPQYSDLIIKSYEDSEAGEQSHYGTYTSPSTPELITDLNLAKQQYEVSTVTCAEADFDATWQEYMDTLKNTGMDKIISEREEYYKNAK